jgi:hypothetical protein
MKPQAFLPGNLAEHNRKLASGTVSDEERVTVSRSKGE